MKKILYIILDGLADEPNAALGNKTALEAALTPNLDRLAQRGVTGVVYPVKKGVRPESDVAVISLLGYDAAAYYCGRGPLEAFAEGIAFDDGDVALRVNFATTSEDGRTLVDRRVGRSLTDDEARALAKEINTKVTLSTATFELKATAGYRGILVLRGMRSKLSGWVTNTDPAYDREGVFRKAREQFENVVQDSRPMAGFEDSHPSQDTAQLLNEFTLKSLKVLSESALNKKRITDKKLPANVILARYAGDHLPHFPIFETVYGAKFGSFVERPVERGIALLAGIEIVDVPSTTGHVDVDYPVWAKIALNALPNYDGIYVHIKGPDEPSHDGDAIRKREIIEAIDKFYFGSLLACLDMKDTIVAVTADHATSCKTKSHTADPVPLLISGGNIKPDGSLSFSEKASRLGSLGELTGTDVLPLVVNHAKV
jgi:2,3-bisphosphoglycerate-independent phosphoglycerate mutase